ncbi:negative elongation factor E-like isoform X1 [Salvelinus alpinus]|uniref:negative elongation factor E-like isoform X1 n=1 Tax=Salvelinus alpinus TaxID=8036 RepID=UPI0039FD915D
METEAGPTNPIGHAAAPAGLVSSGRSSRKKSHSRDRSRLKGHDKDKEKEKDKDKEKEKDRDKDKEKEKEKDRDRDMGRAKAKRSDKQGFPLQSSFGVSYPRVSRHPRPRTASLVHLPFFFAVKRLDTPTHSRVFV